MDNNYLLGYEEFEDQVLKIKWNFNVVVFNYTRITSYLVLYTHPYVTSAHGDFSSDFTSVAYTPTIYNKILFGLCTVHFLLMIWFCCSRADESVLWNVRNVFPREPASVICSFQGTTAEPWYLHYWLVSLLLLFPFFFKFFCLLVHTHIHYLHQLTFVLLV